MRTHTSTTRSKFGFITCQSIPHSTMDPFRTHKSSTTQRKYPLVRSFGGNSSSANAEEVVAAAAGGGKGGGGEIIPPAKARRGCGRYSSLKFWWRSGAF